MTEPIITVSPSTPRDERQAEDSSRLATRPWCLPARGLAAFHGPDSTARLSHYFLPRLLGEGKRVLMLDGANSADPRLIARFARERGVEFGEFSRRIQIARAFTCFQLTELIRRAPRFLRDFPAQAVMVTALPDLYFDEDVRDREACAAFAEALAGLLRLASETRRDSVERPADAGPAGEAGAPALPLSVAVFSAAARFAPSPARRQFLARLCAAAKEVWTFSAGENGRPKLLRTRSMPAAGRIE